MLSVSLVFLYILLSAYIIGFLVLSVIGRIFGKEGRKNAGWAERTNGTEGFIPAGGGPGGGLRLETASRLLTPYFKAGVCGYVMAGLITVTVYAQVFSLFYKVGLLANVILAAVCIVAAAVFRHGLLSGLKRQCCGISKGKKICYLSLFLLFAYGTSRGIIHYDTGLYHAQSIRWIEEYGVVKGLGNLHCRLAYNSSAFSLSALYSFSFLGGQSYHCAAGFLAFLLAAVCSRVLDAWKRKKLLLSDVARFMGIYYLLIIFDEMVSPASDYFMVLTVFYIVIRYLDLVEEGEKDWIPYGLLALACVYTVSLKLSAALIILLAVKPAAMLIKEKNVKGIAGFIALGVCILAPYLVRNVLISGWLVYPLTAIDLFSVDWKIPEWIAQYDAKEIQVWGRGLKDVARYGEPARVWIKEWFAGQGALDKLFIITAAAAVPVSVAALAAAAVKGLEEQRDLMLAAVTVNFSFLCWLFSAPLIRYGCVYVWLAAPITFGGLALWLVRKEGWGNYFWGMIYFLITAAGIYKFFAFGKEVAAAYTPEYFIYQKEYENFEMESYEIEGIKFYYPREGDRAGYEAFPSSPSKADIGLRGPGIRDGFQYKSKSSK